MQFIGSFDVGAVAIAGKILSAVSVAGGDDVLGRKVDDLDFQLLVFLLHKKTPFGNVCINYYSK